MSLTFVNFRGFSISKQGQDTIVANSRSRISLRWCAEGGITADAAREGRAATPNRL